MSKRWAGLAMVLSLSLLAAPLAAQSKGLELGADVGAGLTFGGGSTFFTVTTPTSVRVGVPMGDRMSIEPRFLISLITGEGETVTSFDLTPAFLLAFRDARSGPYVALLPQVSYVSAFDESATQFSAGAGIGIRIQQTDRFGFRVEGQFIHGFENDDFSDSNEVNALLGFTFFTH
jgi:hypothetical protein